MPAGHPCFSSIAYRAAHKSLYVGGVVALLALAGCNGTKGSLVAGLETTSESDNEPAKVSAKAPTVVAKPLPAISKQAAAAKPLVKPDVKKELPKSVAAYGVDRNTTGASAPYKPSPHNAKLSAYCRGIVASAGAKTSLLRSPTISAEVDHQGEVGASINYDVLDLRRANLTEELARAQCIRAEASTRLSRLLITSPQALTRAGYLAKANVLRKNRGEFRKIRRSITQGLNSGLLTVQHANALRQNLDRVAAVESRMRGEAARREVVDDVQILNAAGLDRQLMDAENRIANLQRKMRKTDAYKVSLTGGYNMDGGSESLLESANEELYAKVKVSVRTGVLSRRREQFEDEVVRSRVDNLFENQTGVFWRANEIRRANRRALESLVEQRAQVAHALSIARRNTVLNSVSYQPELYTPRLRARTDVILLKSDLAGLDATIADTQRIDKKLSFK